MILKKQTSLLLIGIFLSLFAQSQELTQTIRGTIIDKILQKPIADATVQIVGTTNGNRSDEKGNFAIKDVPVGSQTLLITAIGYKEYIAANIIVNAGKEVVLTIQLEEKIINGKEIIIKSFRRKNIALNELSAVSTRSFSVEETQKYAAAVNDPARMATNFAGVMAADDGNNQIVIRGNSPSGLLWRMEGIDVPNPNHFAAVGSSGGGISILSSQLLSNSDFSTGAFAAEYGNALSGLFDLKLRKGNNEKKEYSFQAGVLGLNATIEGPFKPQYKGSFLINYRYSTLSILSKMGALPGQAPTNFQDLSYNIYLPTNHVGNFSIFSFGGLSSQYFNAEKDSTKWKNSGQRYSDDFSSNTGMWGITHQINFGKNSLLKSAIGYSMSKIAYDRNYTQNDYSNLNVYNYSATNKRLTFTSILNQRFNAKTLLRSGIIVNNNNFNYNENNREKFTQPIKPLVNTNAQAQTLQAFSQLQFKPNEKITFSGGLHYMKLFLNNASSIEPRASIKWELDSKQTLAFGFGKHSQIQPLGMYFAEENINGKISTPNQNLGFSKANHYVLSHNYLITQTARLKTEVYYQHLYNIPISISDSNTFSALNIQSDYIRIPLTNKGKGKNYGIEISIEKQLSNRFYYMISTSLYQSKYTASNGIEYNTKFNGNKIFNAVAGKEFMSKNKRRTLGLNIKALYAGGYRTTPIDLQRSIDEETTVYIQRNSFQNQLPAYWRSDIRISMKWNRKRFTSTFSLDIQNATNRQNVYDRFYDLDSKNIKTYYQTGILPILNYKVEF